MAMSTMFSNCESPLGNNKILLHDLSVLSLFGSHSTVDF